MAARGRAPSGRTALARLRERIEKGWPPGLTVLTGGDLYHLDRAQQALLAALVPDDSSGFARTVFGEQRVDVAAVVAAARSAGMFAERRVVLVRDLAALEGEADALAAYAAEPPRSSYLLVRAPDIDKRRKLHKTLVTAGVVLEFPAAGAQDAAMLADDVRELAEERGLAVDRPTAVLLAEACACDFYRIDAELQKARSWLGGGGRPALTRELLGELAAGSVVLSGWEVASALLRGRRAEALLALDRLLEGGEEPLRLLGGLAFRARSMMQARALMDGGVPAARALRAARLWGLRPDEAERCLARYSTTRLLGFPGLLLEADRTLKSRSLAPRAVLGAMLERMIPDDDGSRGRNA